MTQTQTLPARETAQPVAALPALPALRLGGLSPLFPPAAVADAGTLRMGGLSPVFARS